MVKQRNNRFLGTNKILMSSQMDEQKFYDEAKKQLENIIEGDYHDLLMIKSAFVLSDLINNDITAQDAWNYLQKMLKKEEPLFEIGDEEKILAYSGKINMEDVELKKDDSNSMTKEKIDLLEQNLVVCTTKIWIAEAKYRELYSHEPFPREMRAYEFPAHPADDIVLKNIAIEYVKTDSAQVKQLWFDYKEKWIKGEISFENHADEYNKVLKFAGKSERLNDFIKKRREKKNEKQ